jgi:ABC-type transport system involved in multi-copper enzyme maturation permease subunit
MQTTGKFSRNLRIILAITSKDILDAIKNKTILSVLLSALFLFGFYMLFPILEQEAIIDLYDAGDSTWISALQDSSPIKVNTYDTLEAMQYRVSRRGEQELGLVLPTGFDQAVASGGPVKLQGYLLNWIDEKKTLQLISQAETQLAGVIGAPVTISVERLFMLPNTTGTALSRAVGTLLLIFFCGLLLVPNLMLEEKRTRTLDALLVSPASSGQITIGKALAGLFFCILAFGLASFFNSPMILQWGLAVLAGVGAALFCISLGLFLGTVVVNNQQMRVTANLLIFPFVIAIFISLEAELLPAWLVSICRWLPPTAAFDLMRVSFTPHTELAFIVPRLAVMLLSIVVLLGVVAWKTRRSDRM